MCTLYSLWLVHMQVQGVVQDRSGRTVATLFGKWDESMHYVMGDCFGKGKGSEQFSEAQLLWKEENLLNFPLDTISLALQLL
jgi:oxysterol-binding protein 1